MTTPMPRAKVGCLGGCGQQWSPIDDKSSHTAGLPLHEWVASLLLCFLLTFAWLSAFLLPCFAFYCASERTEGKKQKTRGKPQQDQRQNTRDKRQKAEDKRQTTTRQKTKVKRQNPTQWARGTEEKKRTQQPPLIDWFCVHGRMHAPTERNDFPVGTKGSQPLMIHYNVYHECTNTSVKWPKQKVWYQANCDITKNWINKCFNTKPFFWYQTFFCLISKQFMISKMFWYYKIDIRKMISFFLY